MCMKTTIVLALFGLLQLVHAKDLDTIVGIRRTDAVAIARQQLPGGSSVMDLRRNELGNVLYINCQKNNLSYWTVIVTTTNVSVRPCFPLTGFNSDGELHHWYDATSREWVFASGARYSRKYHYHLAASPDSTLIAMGTYQKGIECMTGANTNVLVLVTNLTEVSKVGGTTNQMYVLAIDRPGPKVVYHVVSCSVTPAGNYTQERTFVDWADWDFDLDGATGDIIFRERSSFFSANFVYNANSHKRTKLGVRSDWVFFLNHSLAQQLKKLNANVVTQRRE
jgi:hypothetical protein